MMVLALSKNSCLMLYSASFLDYTCGRCPKYFKRDYRKVKTQNYLLFLQELLVAAKFIKEHSRSEYSTASFFSSLSQGREIRTLPTDAATDRLNCPLRFRLLTHTRRGKRTPAVRRTITTAFIPPLYFSPVSPPKVG